MIGPEHERAQPVSGEGFADAVTFAWADGAAERYGFARLGITAGGTGSALAVLFAGREPIGALARGEVDLEDGADWESLALPGLAATVEEPLVRWTVSGDLEGNAIALTFESLSPPAELGASSDVARRGGMSGYEQLCRVRGTVGGVAIDCLGQRGHQWGTPDWDRLELARTVTVWVEDGRGVALSSVRPAGADGHDEELVWAAVLDDAGAVEVEEPRLSTTYDADGRQRRAGLELWMGGDDDFAHRGGGEVLCGSTLDLGRLRLDCSFFAWHLDGRAGIGRYDLLRRTP